MKPIGTAEALARFDALDALEPALLVGDWAGQDFPTGHALDGLLPALGWQGKHFNADGRAHPLVFERPGGGRMALRPLGARWALPWLVRLQPAQRPRLLRLARRVLPLLATRRTWAHLERIDFRGRRSAAMVYDGTPIRDVFRRIDQDTVLGLMDAPGVAPYFFVLRRVR